MRPEDFEDIRDVMTVVYPGMVPWRREELRALLAKFPEGQICIEDQGRVVAAALSIIVDYAKYGDDHSYYQVLGSGNFENHAPDGDHLYGIDVFVHPDYRGMRLGRRLYDARKELCESLNLRGIVIGGRIPNYSKHMHEMTPQEYVRQVKDQKIYDPVLSFQLANDFVVKRINRSYLPEDSDSAAFAVLSQWSNIHYEPRPEPYGGAKPRVRIGVVQWQMRLFQSIEEFKHQVEFFVDSVSGYNADLVLFPELFNAPLMAEFNQENPAEAMRQLAEYTEPLREEFVRLALTYNINIVAGSLPVLQHGDLYNVSFLCRRDGTWDQQMKLHVTPDERLYWGLRGGEELKLFDTDIGKVGILVCYDCEFPELSRLLAEKGMQILLVPYLTDTKTGYLRVRRCAQARAIENECYVAIAGSVGNLPKVENMDINYAQSAVFTPSDFAFPHDAVAAEATPNTEMTLVVDLNLDQLKELRETGSVKNLKSRRPELYSLKWLT